MKDRREVLLGLAFTLGGAAALASCGRAGDDAILEAVAPSGDRKFYSADQHRLLSLISDAIIPRTDTPGALDAGVPDYLDGMMATWASDQTKRDHLETLSMIDEALGGDAGNLSVEARQAAVARLDADAYRAGNGGQGDLPARYRALKSLIATVYYASEPGATEELQFELIPGRWDSDAPLSEIGRTWYN